MIYQVGFNKILNKFLNMNSYNLIYARSCSYILFML